MSSSTNCISGSSRCSLLSLSDLSFFTPPRINGWRGLPIPPPLDLREERGLEFAVGGFLLLLVALQSLYFYISQFSAITATLIQLAFLQILFAYRRWYLRDGTLNLEGVAVWLPSDKADMSPWRMMRSGGFSVMLKMTGGEMARTMRYTEYATAIHERCAPSRHWYLQFIGVDPVFQGKGHAGVLLKPMLARMDTEQASCYLETQNRENVPIYQHYGFRVVEEGTIPGTDVGHWAMLR